jgi:uncharacterized membrane protein
MEKLFFSIKVLSLVGILLAIYLLWEQISHSPVQPCYINNTINCNAIISGPVARTFGIPTPLYGLLGYISILLAAILKKKKLVLGIASGGLLFCLWIAYQEIFLLHVICPVCILCQIIMLTIFLLGIRILASWHSALEPDS